TWLPTSAAPSPGQALTIATAAPAAQSFNMSVSSAIHTIGSGTANASRNSGAAYARTSGQPPTVSSTAGTAPTSATPLVNPTPAARLSPCSATHVSSRSVPAAAVTTLGRNGVPTRRHVRITSPTLTRIVSTGSSSSS